MNNIIINNNNIVINNGPAINQFQPQYPSRRQSEPSSTRSQPFSHLRADLNRPLLTLSERLADEPQTFSGRAWEVMTQWWRSVRERWRVIRRWKRWMVCLTVVGIVFGIVDHFIRWCKR
ncbi:hypothetical protein ONS95_001948 [Cadophora gregata]|uniref:uncharacterized protein n=1 Tax=Cadophora gregata TaxID=51156 RepID=UPI0026DCA30C|nr:uncharacterized protein ONS95_001948 [Cadophora gregata]KAK0111600.1 hypothetical protein ONS95_001948 [Cadophora gregata]KAK0111922.1 hypothetical protein ONS96_001189 [Cadophora gregata f. sp. sojae]